jgi:hypothetical protein
MTDNALVTIRQEQRTALERGDRAAADIAYSRELELLTAQRNVDTPAGPGHPTGVPANFDAEKRLFAPLYDAKYDDWQVSQLRQAWAGREAENFALAKAYHDDHPKMMSIAEKYGLADHPALLEMAAEAARAEGRTFTPAGQQPPATDSQTRPVGYPGQAGAGGAAPRASAIEQVQALLNGYPPTPAKMLQKLNEQIAEAQARGDSSRANELSVLQMDYLREQQGGSQPIVNGRRTA